jgi:uncharacterized protein
MKYDTALITGASAGLGKEFAHQLAPHCRRLVLAARRRPPMEDLARVLRGAFPGLEVHVFETDLADPGDLEELVAALARGGLVPELVVNNAGLGDYGEFAVSEWSRVEAMLQVNIRALTRLCHAVVPAMQELGRGAILNVSSLAGELPIPDFAVYAATKAYVTSFSEALRLELRGTGIKVLALCPGPVHTEFGAVARRRGGPDLGGGPREWFTIDRERVVAEGLAALEAGKARHFPGLLVAAAAVGISLLPLCLLRPLLATRPRRG